MIQNKEEVKKEIICLLKEGKTLTEISQTRFADYIYYDGCISLDRKQLAINNIKQGLQEK